MSPPKELFLSLLTVIILLTAACSPSRSGTQGAFDPDDPDNPRVGLEAGGGQETLFIEPGNIVEYDAEYADFILRMRVRRIGQGALGIAFHSSPVYGTYILLLEEGRFTLQREVKDQIQQAVIYEFENQPVEWHQLELEMLGADIRVYHLDQIVIEYTDPSPLPPGGLSFETMGDLAIEIEHLDLELLGDTAVEDDQLSAEPEKDETSQPSMDNPADPPALPASELAWVRLAALLEGQVMISATNLMNPPPGM